MRKTKTKKEKKGDSEGKKTKKRTKIIWRGKKAKKDAFVKVLIITQGI